MLQEPPGGLHVRLQHQLPVDGGLRKRLPPRVTHADEKSIDEFALKPFSFPDGLQFSLAPDAYMLKNRFLPFQDLPQVQDLPFETFPRSGIGVSMLARLLIGVPVLAVVFLLALLIGPARFWLPLAAGLLLPLMAVFVLWPRWAWPHHRLALREHDIVLRGGLIFRWTAAQSLNRVQHVKVEQGPLQRRRQLATLTVLTAGGSAGSFALHNLHQDRAEQVREYILNYQRTPS
ncbi:MAG: PH domain-containing protein [Rhodanobacteraceae bacterium]|nr:PH domain-containing protein [Rhodanobacteraceae bacterium]